MSTNGGRKSKYDQVAKRIPEILAWRRQDGLTEKQIAEKLGIHISTLQNYKNTYPEFAEVMKEAKQAIISDVLSSLIKRAKGYSYEEKKVYQKEESGKLATYTEITTHHEPPNVAACSLLLKNLDKEHDWSDNPTMLAVKREEVELRKKLAEADEWAKF